MSIVTPEIGSLCGAIDSDAIADGEPFGAHWLRPLIRSSNRLIAKSQQLFNLVWPEATYGEDGLYLFEGVGPLHWIRVLPPIPLGSRPGLASMDVWLRMLVPSTHSIEVFIATIRRPFRPGLTPDATIAGSGSFANTTISAIPIDDSGFDECELWLRGVPSNNLANTATYGAPNTRAAVAGSYFVRTFETMTLLDLSAATWNESGTTTNNLASGGHYVRFEDGSGNIALPGKTIVMVTSPTTLHLELGLSAQQAAIAQELNAFSIVQLPRYALSNFGAVALARTT